MLVVSGVMALNLLAADLAGTWNGSMPTKEGTMEIIVTIKPGTALIGKVQVGEYESEIAFAMKIGTDTVTYTGKVSANGMKLDVVGTQGAQYKPVCTRK
jgi:hypothetical protein